jgi:hypothetical protein
LSRTQINGFTFPIVSDLYRDGIYFRSRTDGRYILFRGVCFGPTAKLPPYLPIHSPEDWPRFETYLDLLLACGFNVMRLPFSWAALEPHCDPTKPIYNLDYFEKFFEIVEHLTNKGFTIFIDIHQDLLQAAYGGNGFPTWVREDGATDSAFLLNTPLWGLNYVMNKGLRRSFTQFWRNSITNTTVTPPLIKFAARDRFLDMIEFVAARAAKHARVLGVEIVNEPHPAELDAEAFERELLTDFYREATQRIRKHSKELFVMLAPQSDWNVNLRSDKRYRSLLRNSGTEDDRLIFAYHYYDSLLTGLHGLHFHERKREEYLEAVEIGVQQAKEKEMLPFLTEFGSRQNWFRGVTRRHMHWHFEAVERALVSSTYWNVNLYNTTKERDGFMREDFSLIDENHEPRNLDIATRPYPIASSAKPVRMSFNDRTKIFDLVLHGKPTKAETVIFLPYSQKPHKYVPAHFSGGFKVYYNHVTSGLAAARLDVACSLLYLTLDPNAEEHHIMIVPLGEKIIANSDQIILTVGAES